MRAILLGICGAALAACAQTPDPGAQPAAIQTPPVQEAPPAPAAAVEPAANPAWMGRLTDAAKASRMKLDFDGKAFSGPAWDTLVAEGKAAQFFLLGEEHGIAENPKLAAQLFETLAKDGYSKLVIEVSPPMAAALDESARKGMAGLTTQLLSPGASAAFFTMQQEAEMLMRVRAAVPADQQAFWGVDYEVGGDRLLIGKLKAMPKPKAAEEALATLEAASEAAWAKYATEKNPGLIFTFSGDPALVRAVRDVWPDCNAEASRILTTLEETLEINRLWVTGEGFDSNVRRSTFIRTNFLAHWQAERAAGRMPKVFAKMGSSHLMRGRNSTETYDLGSLVPELATMAGVKTLQVAIMPGATSQVAVFDPVAWSYTPASAKDGYTKGLEPLYAAAFEDGFTLINLRLLRPILGGGRTDVEPELMRTVYGYDFLLLMTGSTPSSNLKP